MRLCALEWLRATGSQLGLRDLERLRKSFGFELQDHKLFNLELQNACRALINDQPCLRRWIALRISLLEFETGSRRPFPEEAQRNAVNLRSMYERLLCESFYDVKSAVDAAQDCLKQSLETAAQVVVSLFGEPGRGSHNANIMLPVGQFAADFVAVNAFARNQREADRVWGLLPEYQRRKRLTIVAETEGSEHIGFWVPLVSGNGNEDLPGASAAVKNGVGSAVFKHELPPLRGFSPDIEKTWHAHMATNFSHALFVALPFYLPAGVANQPQVVAVLNVNVDAKVEEGWHRAMHDEWLSLARNRVSQFMEVAFKSLVFLNEATQRSLFPELPALAGHLGTLPAARHLLSENVNDGRRS